MRLKASDSPDPRASCQVTLAVLAGGLGSRMGKPKSLLEVGGKPILRWIHERYSWPGPTLLVTAPACRHPPGQECFVREVTDPADGQGPLRGILTALEHTATPCVGVTTVDMPGVRSEHMLWLMDELLGRPELLGIMPARSADATRPEPFPCVLRRQAATAARELLESGRRAVHLLACDDRFAVIPVPPSWPPEMWANLNSPEDFHAWIRAL